jgi:lysyl endopeptidase
MRFLARLFALAALACASSLQVQAGPWVGGERALGPKAVEVPRLHLSAQAKSKALPTHIELTPPDAADMAAVRSRNRPSMSAKRVTIGVNRPLQSAAVTRGSDLAWTEVDAGAAAQASMTSSGAAAMRMSIELAGVPADVQMVFFGSDDPSRLFGPVRVGDIADRTQAWWSPITEGDTQTVEFFAPGASAERARSLVITGAAHLFAGPSSKFTKRVQEIGDAGACNIDTACSPLATSTPFQDAVASVAQMVFTSGAFQGLCTGTLLNDSDPSTQVPYFFSANHCFDNENPPPFNTPAQMQTVANSLTTIWHFEANACHSATPVSNWTQVSGGAQFLYGNPQQDALFLRLNNAPPEGSWFLGWDASTAANGTPVAVIHHPSGDLKKVSLGSILRLTASQSVGGGTIPFYEVAYNSGTTEPGSSGSGLLTNNGTQYLLRGALWGGFAACDAITESDFYSRFDLIYPSIAQFLGSNGSAIDYTDLWWGGDSQSGWGLNIMQHATRNIFAVWYTYDATGRMMWYVLPGGTWTSPTSFTGNIYATTGPAGNAASFDPNAVTRRIVGTGTLNFSDANNGTFAFSIDGVSSTKSLTRQPF